MELGYGSADRLAGRKSQAAYIGIGFDRLHLQSRWPEGGRSQEQKPIAPVGLSNRRRAGHFPDRGSALDRKWIHRCISKLDERWKKYSVQLQSPRQQRSVETGPRHDRPGPLDRKPWKQGASLP